MDNWYLRDSRGGQVGPVSRQVAVDLIRSRPGFFLHVSNDNISWKPLARQPQVQSLVGAEAPDLRRRRETEEAQRLLFDLDRFRDLKPHQLFGVPATATIKDFRAGFAARAKHVHPGRLPRDVAPELLRAQMAVYQYLTEVLQNLEKRFANAAAASVAPPPAPPSREAVWNLTKLHLQQTEARLKASLDIDASTAHVFSVHRLMNLNNASVFFPCLPTLGLGTRMSLTFHFVEAGRDIEALGAVALESGTVDHRNHLRGFGVRLDGLNAEMRGFMLREVERLTQPPPRASTPPRA